METIFRTIDLGSPTEVSISPEGGFIRICEGTDVVYITTETAPLQSGIA